MNSIRQCQFRLLPPAVWLVLAGIACPFQIRANPTGGTVGQGAASISGMGTSQVTINQTSANALINWQSFNIASGETTTFVQPSSSSVTWNQIGDANPSQILGNLNANGYVILQNQNGFYFGGSSVVNTHGLLVTTSPTPAPDLSSGGPWSFNAPPPTAQIINYGQINIAGGGSAFLIASDIENDGTISAPGGNIGLYAGQKVLVSMSPDGRGLSAQITLPQGSVDNSGKLIADAGVIAAQAKLVNQSGLIQADSVQNINGTIELVASGSLNLNAGSTISAAGDPAASSPSPGGFVVLKSGNTFADTTSSTIAVAGQSGGQDGIVEIFGTGVTANTVKSAIGDNYALLINPYDISLSSAATTESSSPTLNVNDLSSYAQIDLYALDTITLKTSWDLPDPGSAARLNLTAGNSIMLNTGFGITAENNWSINMIAGTQLAYGSSPASGSDGIYLKGSAYITSANGDINLQAANEVQVGWQGKETLGTANTGQGYVTTTDGGNISVSAAYGDINTGASPNGYLFSSGLLPDSCSVSSLLGGISTAAGGNVTLTAGGNVTSYLPLASSLSDAGSGAFGCDPGQAGNVTVSAGGNVYGHFVVADGVGNITSQNGNVGALIVGTDQNGNPTYNSSFALSLIAGSWNVNAPNGSIYLQEVRNPNGTFNYTGNPTTNPSQYLFNYDPEDSVSLNAGNAVAITGGSNMPRVKSSTPVPIVLPPTLEVTAGSGGFTLYNSITLFQSPDGNVNITTLDGGDFTGVLSQGGSSVPTNPQLFMSSSDNSQWGSKNTLKLAGAEYASTPAELDNPNPVVINVSGSLENVDIYTTKATEITVGRDMTDSSFVGENLHPADVSFVNVAGTISYGAAYATTTLDQPITPIPYGVNNPVNPPQWDTIFYLMVNPAVAASLTIPGDITSAQLTQNNYYATLSSLSGAQNLWVFPGTPTSSNPGFGYNAQNLLLTYASAQGAIQMSQTTRDFMDGWNGNYDGSGNKIFNTTTINGLTYGVLSVVSFNSSGIAQVSDGHLVLGNVTFVSQNAINQLYTSSQTLSSSPGTGIQIGGPGLLNVTADSLELGDSQGIDSWGIVGPVAGTSSEPSSPNYNYLAGLTASGAGLNVTVNGDLTMLTSRIASMYGGDVYVNVGGAIDLSGVDTLPPSSLGVYPIASGIYTSGHSDVHVTAVDDIEVNGSRIAAFDGGNVFVTSLQGSLDVGNGANSVVKVPLVSSTPILGYHQIGSQNYFLGQFVYGSGILAVSLPDSVRPAGGGSLPGNITINTPNGDISSSDAGILQYALSGTTEPGPIITLIAGTPGVAATSTMGNIDFGSGGVIGGTINISAQGDVSGVIISEQNSTINTAGNFSGTLVAGGTASVAASGSVSGTIVGIGGIAASGGSVDATLLSQNVSVGGGQSESTLGTTATASSASQSAAATSSNDATQQANSDTDNQDDEKKKKNNPVIKRISRVTVLLSSATAPR